MKLILAATAAAAAIALGACSPGANDKQAMIDSCVKDSQDKAVCTCMVNEFEKNLDKESFAAMAKASTKGEEAVQQEFIASLTPEKMMKFGQVMASAGQKCTAPSQPS